MPPLTTDTYTSGLLPGREDKLRWNAENAVRTERRLRETVHSLLRESLLDGREHAAMLGGAALGIQIVVQEGSHRSREAPGRRSLSRQTRSAPAPAKDPRRTRTMMAAARATATTPAIAWVGPGKPLATLCQLAPSA